VPDSLDESPRGSSEPAPLESTARLLAHVREGVPAARERLVERYLPLLMRWAHGRLPARARGIVETGDLVHITLLRALDKVKEFEPRREGAFLSYLRSILMNQIRDEIRRAARRPEQEEVPEDLPAADPSPLEEAIGRDTLARYEAALSRLSEEQREAVILWVEMDFTHEQLAEALERPSANAARMFLTRALARLAEVMDDPTGA
jgi:RNA polymerase sigma-70 factor (ECF subfamily)